MKISVGYVTLSCKEHKHNCYEIIFYRKGNGSFYFNKDSLVISPGKFVIVPPGTVHASKYTEEAETIYIKGDFKHIFSFAAPTVVMDNDGKTGAFLVNLIFENRFSNQEYLSSLVNALVHMLLQNIRTEKSISTVIKEIITEIEGHFYDASLNPGECLKRSGYAEDYIRAQFKRYTGKTPVTFLTEIRINHACYLIEVYKDSLSLSEIAEKCGFTDYVYFSRKFKQVMGMSPKSYMEI